MQRTAACRTAYQVAGRPVAAWPTAGRPGSAGRLAVRLAAAGPRAVGRDAAEVTAVAAVRPTTDHPTAVCPPVHPLPVCLLLVRRAARWLAVGCSGAGGVRVSWSSVVAGVGLRVGDGPAAGEAVPVRETGRTGRPANLTGPRSATVGGSARAAAPAREVLVAYRRVDHPTHRAGCFAVRPGIRRPRNLGAPHLECQGVPDCPPYRGATPPVCPGECPAAAGSGLRSQPT